MQIASDDPENAISDANKNKKNKFVATATDKQKFRLGIMDLIESIRRYNNTITKLIDYGFTEKTISVFFGAKLLNIYNTINDIYSEQGAPLQTSGVEQLEMLTSEQILGILDLILGTRISPTRATAMTAIMNSLNARRALIDSDVPILEGIRQQFQDIDVSRDYLKALYSTLMRILGTPLASRQEKARRRPIETRDMTRDDINDIIMRMPENQVRRIISLILNFTSMNVQLVNINNTSQLESTLFRQRAVFADFIIGQVVSDQNAFLALRTMMLEFLNSIDNSWNYNNVNEIIPGEAVKKPRMNAIEDETFNSIVGAYPDLTDKQKAMLIDIIQKLSENKRVNKLQISDEAFYNRINSVFTEMIRIISSRASSTASNDPNPNDTISRQRTGYFTTFFDWLSSVGFNDVYQIITNPIYTRAALEDIINTLLTNQPIETPIKPIAPVTPTTTVTPDIEEKTADISSIEQPSSIVNTSTTLSDNSFISVPLTQQDALDLNALKNNDPDRFLNRVRNDRFSYSKYRAGIYKTPRMTPAIELFTKEIELQLSKMRNPNTENIFDSDDSMSDGESISRIEDIQDEYKSTEIEIIKTEQKTQQPSRARQAISNTMKEVRKKLQNVMNELRKKYNKFSLSRRVRIKINDISRSEATMQDATQWLIDNNYATDIQSAQQYLNYEYGMIRDYTEEDRDRYEDIPIDELGGELLDYEFDEFDEDLPDENPPDGNPPDGGDGDPSGPRGGGRGRRRVPQRPSVFNGLSRRQWLLLLLIIVLLSTGVVSLNDVFKKGKGVDDTGKTTPPLPPSEGGGGGGGGGGTTGGGGGGTTGGGGGAPAAPSIDIGGGKSKGKWSKIGDSDFLESVGLGGSIRTYNDMVDRYNSLPKSQQKSYDDVLSKYYDAISKATSTPTLNELKTARNVYDDLKKQYDTSLSDGSPYDRISSIYYSLRNSINFLNNMTTKYVDLENGFFSFLGQNKTKDSDDVTIDDVDANVLTTTLLNKGKIGKAKGIDSSFSLMSKGMRERILKKLENRNDPESGILKENNDFINYSIISPNGGLGTAENNPLIRKNKEYERLRYLNADPVPQPYMVPSLQQIYKNSKQNKPILHNVIQIDDTLNYDSGNVLINQNLYDQNVPTVQFSKSRLYNPEYHLEELNKQNKNIKTNNDIIGRSGAYYGIPTSNNQYYQYGIEQSEKLNLNNYPNTTVIKMGLPVNIKSHRILPNSYSLK